MILSVDYFKIIFVLLLWFLKWFLKLLSNFKIDHNIQQFNNLFIIFDNLRQLLQDFMQYNIIL